VRLFDDTTISGQLVDEELTCRLRSGPVVKVPLAVVAEYEQPYPEPPPQTLERVKQIVADLNAEDWKERDRAQGQLASMGPVVIGVLREMRPLQSAEGQRRIDVVLEGFKSGQK
jgi:hypothetical protein